MKRTFGTHRDFHDHRDHAYAAPDRLLRRRPRNMDLRPAMPPMYNQGRLNSCSANAIASVMWYDMRREEPTDTHSPSRLFIYYNERAREGLTGSNAPVSLRDGYRSVAKRGACEERLWPYLEHRFAHRPPAHCYRNGYAHRAVRYMRIKPDLRHMQACLADGFPFTFGMTVYASFLGERTRRTGTVTMPRKRDVLKGGHAMVVVGYRTSESRFIVRNSFGPRWGDAGYCYMPFDYLLDDRLAWDFWTVRRMSRRHK